MEKERGMEERPSTPALQEFPQLSRLHFFSPPTQGVIADYCAHLRARRGTPSQHPVQWSARGLQVDVQGRLAVRGAERVGDDDALDLAGALEDGV